MIVISWIFRQFVHLDANFRLTREAVAKQSSLDVGLWEGKAFFVEDETYRSYLQTVSTNKQQVSNITVVCKRLLTSRIEIRLRKSPSRFK